VSPVSANFGFLNEYGEGLVVLGAQAECYFTADPVTARWNLPTG
jgi:hypothetical protein